MKKLYFFLMTILISTASFGQIIITELADPDNELGARYVEIYNVSDQGVDLTNWELRRWTNGNVDPQTTGVDLTSIGTLAPGNFAIIAANGTTFLATYGFSPNISAGAGGAADSNGDDQIAVFNAADETIDIFGVPGEDGTDTCHEFEDGRAERIASITSSASTWNEAEWNVWADTTVSGCTNHINNPQNAPGNFDPGAWIGAPTTAITLTIFDGPANGSIFTMGPEDVNPTIEFAVTNFTVGVPNAGDGYIVWNTKDDGGTIIESGQIQDINTIISPTFIPGNTYSLNAELVDNNGDPLDPAVTYIATVTFKAYNQVANLAALRAGTVGDYYEVTGEVIGTWSQSYRNQKWAQDSSAGIMLDDDSGIITTTYNEGDGITGIKGQLAEYSGLLQLLPTIDPGTATSTGNVVTPEVVTITQLIADHEPYESELIKIVGATFDTADGIIAFANFSNLDISDAGAGPISFSNYMLRDTDYIGEIVPQGSQDLIVLVGDFNGVQVAARSVNSDIILSVVENQIEGFAMYPNPVTNGKFTISSNSSVEKNIEIFSFIGKQVYTKKIKVNETIDISNLTTGLYLVRVEEEGKIATRKLIVK